ncbi:hypothetical protein BDZ85DRAFT_294275 [Elsinoe ampelina]|uniref:BTB domain-containing protein n=1 Tax=Elsinoe ampelina TaxID=302913 RepID=A0A6A6GJB2_9PEZI|nr:hypothetical protein BDZ85DRAFT_294275 [Elsinoe ampelina]
MGGQSLRRRPLRRDTPVGRRRSTPKDSSIPREDTATDTQTINNVQNVDASAIQESQTSPAPFAFQYDNGQGTTSSTPSTEQYSTPMAEAFHAEQYPPIEWDISTPEDPPHPPRKRVKTTRTIHDVESIDELGHEYPGTSTSSSAIQHDSAYGIASNTPPGATINLTTELDAPPEASISADFLPDIPTQAPLPASLLPVKAVEPTPRTSTASLTIRHLTHNPTQDYITIIAGASILNSTALILAHRPSLTLLSPFFTHLLGPHPPGPLTVHLPSEPPSLIASYIDFTHSHVLPSTLLPISTGLSTTFKHLASMWVFGAKTSSATFCNAIVDRIMLLRVMAEDERLAPGMGKGWDEDTWGYMDGIAPLAGRVEGGNKLRMLVREWFSREVKRATGERLRWSNEGLWKAMQEADKVGVRWEVDGRAVGGRLAGPGEVELGKYHVREEWLGGGEVEALREGNMNE